MSRDNPNENRDLNNEEIDYYLSTIEHEMDHAGDRGTEDGDDEDAYDELDFENMYTGELIDETPEDITAVGNENTGNNIVDAIKEICDGTNPENLPTAITEIFTNEGRGDIDIENKSSAIVSEIIFGLLKESVIKSLEEIAATDTDTDTEFIRNLMSELILKTTSENTDEIENIIKDIKDDITSDIMEDETDKTTLHVEELESDIIVKEIIEEYILKQGIIEKVDEGEMEEIEEETKDKRRRIFNFLDEIEEEEEKSVKEKKKEETEEKFMRDEEDEEDDLKMYFGDVNKILEELDDEIRVSFDSHSYEEIDQQSGLSSFVVEDDEKVLHEINLQEPRDLLPDILPSYDDVEEEPIRESATPHPPVDPVVLEPESPLMIRFQAALKSHILKQKSRFQEEILDLNGEIKEKDKKLISVSAQVYNAEATLNRQQENLNKMLNNIQEINASLDNATNMTEQMNYEYKKNYDLLQAAKKKENELHLELESLSALVKKFTEWEEIQAKDINITKLMTERQKIEKKKMFEEKQKLDVLILVMRKDVLKLTSFFDELKTQTQDKMEELNAMLQAVADANADIETLLLNNDQVMKCWQRNTLLIAQRDKVLLQMKEAVEQHKLKFYSLQNELETAKKECNCFIKQNEELVSKLQRSGKLYHSLKKTLKEEIEKKRGLQVKLAQVARMEECTDCDLRDCKTELNGIQKKLSICSMQWEKMKEMNYQLEEKILDKLKEQSVENKTAEIINNQINQLRNTLREKEVLMAEYENKIAKAMVKTEKQRMIYECGELSLNEAKRKVQNKEDDVEKLQVELERTKNCAQRTQAQVDKFQRKLEQLKEHYGELELSPEEIKIRELEKHIFDLDQQIEELQLFWSRQESHIVAVSQERKQQLHQISALRKQMIRIDKKIMQIEFEINEEEKQGKNYRSSIANYQKKLTQLNEQCFLKKGYKEMLDNDNLTKQDKYLSDLKEAEDEAQLLRKEIEDLEKEKAELYNRIEELQKEVLAWEKKLQMTVETHQLLKSMHGEGGELANMKNEIHRMEIRYSELCKAQEKLAQDMESCVTRRDAIVDTALAREKHSSKGKIHYTRQQFLKKINDMNNGIRQNSIDLRNVEKECQLEEKKKFELEEQLELKNEQLFGLKKATEQMDLQLAEGHLHRQKNLEMLVRLQRRARLYSELKGSRYKLLFRNESALELEAQKQRKINSDLTAVVEALILDFPSLQMPFTALLNSLNVGNIDQK
ncbi:lethal (2) 41Ab [Lycorma delicatula]|uniref:lethal (2) 41Ab n=1 Tax=Lycorma delicatula TaxID=130591 RepID=UPI003F51298C